MKKTRVGVLRGGPSSEYEVSLKSGETVLKNLPDHYEAVDIFIDKKGLWHIHGVRHDPHKALQKVDVIFNAMHGEYGEDGQVQEMLDRLGARYTGSKSFPSRLAMNKALTKEFAAKNGIKTPIARLLERKDYDKHTASRLYRTFPQPSVVKPMALGSSVGVTIAKSLHELEEALKKAFSMSDSVLIEEYIKGREATCGVVENFAGEDYHALAPIEIVPEDSKAFYDYDAKYLSDNTNYLIPGNFTADEMNTIRHASKIIHQALGLRHYSRSDFIVSPRRGIYFLEVNTLPGLTSHSLLPKAVVHSGMKLPDFLDHIILQALNS